MPASCRLRHLALIGLTIAWDTAARSAEPPDLKPAAALAPQKEILAYAAAHTIAADRLELAGTGGDGRAGDTITALIAARDRKGTRQWLTQFTFADATEKEKANSPASTAVMTINERKFEFPSGVPVALEIRTIGPFSTDKAPATQQARTLISPAFLALGIDRACEAMRQMDELSEKLKKSGSKAAPELSEENARAFAGLFPAMIAYFAGAQSTPGLREIMWDLIEKPSLWSIVKHGGKIEPNFDFDGVAVANPADWGLKDVACYRLALNLSLNGRPAIRCAFFVTSPKPPLLTSAGIVGIVAESPADAAKRVDIRVLAAHRAPP